MDKLYIVMPAYNEGENIEAVVRSWYKQLEGKSSDSKLVVADSGSTDNTHDILLKLKADMTQLEILTDSDRQHGPKVIALYKYAINQGADYIFQTDSDGQTDPNEFPPFWDKRTEYDIVLGHRVNRGDGKQRDFVEKVVCMLLKIYFGVKVPDANVPFRLMKASVVAKYLHRLRADYNIPNIMLTTWFAYYHEKITFQKISFKPRQGGVNSVNILWIMKIGWKALGDFKTFKKEMAG